MKHLVRYCIFLTFYFSITHISFAQKPVLDTSIFGNWPHVIDPYISNDGNYFIYTFNNETRGSVAAIVKGIHNKREWHFPGISSGKIKFTDNSKQVFFLTGKDSLCRLSLDNGKFSYISGISEFTLFMHGKIEYLLYRQTDSALNKDLVIRRLDNGDEQRFNGVERYSISSDGRLVSLERERTVNGKESSELILLTIPSGTKQVIYEGERIRGDVIFDKLGEQLAFISLSPVEKEKDRIIRTVWSYKVGGQQATRLISDKGGIINEMQLGRLLHFNKKRNYIYCWAREKNLPVAKEDAVKVDVWHYKDAKLQSQQLQNLEPDYFMCVINVETGAVKQISDVNESVVLDEDEDSQVEEERILVTYRKGDQYENYWNPDAKAITDVINGDDFKRQRLIDNSRWTLLPPGGKYIYQYDSLMHDLYSYEIHSGIFRNITANMPIPAVDSSQDTPILKYFRGLIVAGWLSDDAGILLSDGFDIWKVDPKAEKVPICLTNGYGRRNNITFNFAINQEKKLLNGHEKVVLRAFDNNTKKSGFYNLKLDQPSDPKFLSMDSCRYEFIRGTDIIVKSTDKDIYIVCRGNTKSSPNFYWTKDFRNFTSLTFVHPERRWNWLSSELINWTGVNGEAFQGVLYKPEDFDSTKKYPIIFNYYEILSNNLYRYQLPEETKGLLNIPWFVSHGYLVFTPDIHFRIGYPGESSLKTVESAARHMSRYTWVDSAHMGLQGHSWSGYQTAYIITHSSLFAAASEGAGPTNFISDYGAIFQEGVGMQFFTEDQQFRIGTTLWERPDLYIKNSPIFSVDRVTTPLLMMHSKADNVVPFAQGVELFTAFRRLGKKAWMLQYDNGNHGVGGKEAVDFTIRMTQFFDYYLKQTLPPKWMSRGIPARIKGADLGLELDHSNIVP